MGKSDDMIRKIAIIGVALSAWFAGRATAQQIVDVHCHNILPDFVNALDAHDAALDETFPLPAWNVESHLEFMDVAGIKMSVLSMPAPQPYFGNADECRDIIRRYNGQTAAICREHPERFTFVAALPLPDVQMAIDEAVYALDSLGAVGVKLATNSRGQYLGDAELDPLMEVLNKRKAVIILHPHKPSSVNEGIIATAPLAIYEYPAETTRAVINLIARNVPARYPYIKWVIPHCGSFLSLAVPRMKAVLPAMIAKNLMQSVDWEANLASLYYDLAGGATPDVVKSLLTITTPDHLLYGSDYPYQTAEMLSGNLRRLQSWMAEDKELAPYLENILADNALELFSERTERYDKMEINTGQQTGMCRKMSMQPDGIVRLSKIEVYPEYLDEYMKFATEVGETSLRTEPGVLTMYAMSEKDTPCRITILETYASQEAYKSHIASLHFQKYKQGTLHMVKSLVLSDQTPLNPANQISNFIR